MQNMHFIFRKFTGTFDEECRQVNYHVPTVGRKVSAMPMDFLLTYHEPTGAERNNSSNLIGMIKETIQQEVLWQPRLS